MKPNGSKGDGGLTDLIGGERVHKDDPRICICGDLDELSSVIGLVIVTCDEEDLRSNLLLIQTDLVKVATQIVTAEADMQAMEIENELISRLEQQLESIRQSVPLPTGFILPGGCESSARLHHARTVCRRAERSVVSLSRNTNNKAIITYLNRLGGFLFYAALLSNQHAGIKESIAVFTAGKNQPKPAV